MSKFHRPRKPKPKKDDKPFIPQPMPLKAHTRVLQLQFFDNMESKRGKSRHTMTIESYSKTSSAS